ncbi:MULTISPECIES: GPP34 family phosphoprotein [unclassified Streptomyces]|uniref:GOLPH3/VPS74 family protein n=1 Tax=unclassified Streptomyces TaxID=2593676 RepID=UPI000DB98DAD|nr:MULTISPECIES: GPP34 family phosphoprotein [unclassified Streptomyces]MYT69047.1 GPP34 family phosphoprotein [Streptomyces sp. SID8367]RAJ82555.1 Golgi phosphoprotein 3 GPP34 [Streptomyces sp. PsTaAH-137]
MTTATTAQDLTLVALDVPHEERPEPGALSLALAGAEAVDLITSGALSLDGDRMVPGPRQPGGDSLLDRAASALVRKEPYETVENWLWRRGPGLAAAYVAELERSGLIARPRPKRHGFWSRPADTGRGDSPARRAAQARAASCEPVLVELLAATRRQDTSSWQREDDRGDDAVVTVLAAVGEAVTQLEAARLRRAIENDAFDNIWRA